MVHTSTPFNCENAVLIHKLRLCSEETFYNCYIDPEASAPAGFIGVREADDLQKLKYVKVANIMFFEIDGAQRAQFWQEFDVLPETVKAK